MTHSSIWAAMNVARAECGLAKKHDKLCTHTLRHSYATHMLDAGTSLRQISAYLGPHHPQAHPRYLHLTEISEAKARDALRTLPGV